MSSGAKRNRDISGVSGRLRFLASLGMTLDLCEIFNAQVLIVERGNAASVRVLGKLGMKYKRETLFYGVKMDVYQVDGTSLQDDCKRMESTKGLA